MYLLVLSLAAISCLGSTSNVRTGSGQCPSTILTTDRLLEDEYEDQPLYLIIGRDTEENRRVDNACYTYYTLPDDCSTFLVYESTVFCDGTNVVETFIYKQESPGATIFSNSNSLGSQDSIGSIDCSGGQVVNVYFACFICGDSGSLISGLSRTYGKASNSCLLQARSLQAAQGLAQDYGYYTYPMNLPPQCVYKKRSIAQKTVYPAYG